MTRSHRIQQSTLALALAGCLCLLGAVSTRAAGPVLTIGSGTAQRGQPVTVPVSLLAAGAKVSAASFSIEFDPTVLSFDPADQDGDGIPDAVAYQVPSGFVVMAQGGSGNAVGKLDIVVMKMLPPLVPLPDGELVAVSFTVAPSAPAGSTALRFGRQQPPSLGTVDGQSVAVTPQDGAVMIGTLAGGPAPTAVPTGSYGSATPPARRATDRPATTAPQGRPGTAGPANTAPPPTTGSSPASTPGGAPSASGQAGSSPASTEAALPTAGDGTPESGELAIAPPGTLAGQTPGPANAPLATVAVDPGAGTSTAGVNGSFAQRPGDQPPASGASRNMALGAILLTLAAAGTWWWVRRRHA